MKANEARGYNIKGPDGRRTEKGPGGSERVRQDVKASDNNTMDEKQKYNTMKEVRQQVEEYMTAAQSGNLKKMKAFMKKMVQGGDKDNAMTEADIVLNYKDGNGKSGLHFAVGKGKLEMCKFILKTAADTVHMEDDTGERPLSFACMNGNPDIVALLIQEGCDVWHASQKGVTALHRAAGEGHVEIMELLMAAESKTSTEARVEGKTGEVQHPTAPLHWAAGVGHTAAVEKLVGWGADVNAPGDNGVPPIILASAAGFTAIVVSMVEAGADSGFILQGGLTVLHICSELGQLPAVKALLETETGKKCATKASDEGDKPIFLAAAEGHREVVEALLPHSSLPSDTTVDSIIRIALTQTKKDEASGKAGGDAASEGNEEAKRVPVPVSEENVKAAVECKNNGNKLVAEKKWTEAVAEYTKGIGLDPNSHVLFSNRRYIYTHTCTYSCTYTCKYTYILSFFKRPCIARSFSLLLAPPPLLFPCPAHNNCTFLFI
jgi:ankyrin repeat protein